VECEQLVWPYTMPLGRPLPFSVYLWRRGTIPIWWEADIKGTLMETNIHVHETNPYVGSDVYFRRLINRYPNANDKNNKLRIVCINLLKTSIGEPELQLSQHFQEAINYITSNNEVPNANLCLMNYDWDANTMVLGVPNTVHGLWQLLKDPTIGIGFGMGEYHDLNIGKQRDIKKPDIPNKGLIGGGGFRMVCKQEGVLRFSCRNSLNRTNVASFLGIVQVLMEQCLRLGLPLDSPKYVPPLSQEGRSPIEPPKESLGPLPPGWEERNDFVTGQVFYVDHNVRTTTWCHPCPDKPWRRFDMTIDEFRGCSMQAPITELVDLFLKAADVHAMLYTSSKATRSDIIQIFGEQVNIESKSISNNRLDDQHGCANVLLDSTHQKQQEMFLGLRYHQHFPTIPSQPLQVFFPPPLLSTIVLNERLRNLTNLTTKKFG
jgi:hypothetical protein